MKSEQLDKVGTVLVENIRYSNVDVFDKLLDRPRTYSLDREFRHEIRGELVMKDG
jgi:hypothetical protein